MKWFVELMRPLAEGLSHPKTPVSPPVTDPLLFGTGDKLPECREHDLAKHRTHAYRYEDLLM